MRPTWDQHFMSIAHTVAQRSTCPRASVGCVLTFDNRILTTGHNGSPSKFPHCIDVGCLMADGHCVRCIHAEQNAIIQGARDGIHIANATCYTTHFPCFICAKMLINAGVLRVVYSVEYGDTTLSRMFFEYADIETERIEL